MSEVLKKKYQEEAREGYDYRRAMEEAARCLLCEDAPCSRDCPAATDPGKFIRSLRFKNIKGAAETIRENNPLGGCCAWVCPYDRMCEKACSRTGIDRPIEIGRLQRFLIEEEQKAGSLFVKGKQKNGKKVACIGAGPASLACARELAAEGYSVSIYESREKAGGVLSYGITPTRLPQYVVDHDVELIQKLGVEFKFGIKVDSAQLEELKKKYDAVFVGIGLWASKFIKLKGMELEGVDYALDFLAEARSNTASMKIEENVIVIGGGNVAMDCVTTAKQLGSGKALIVYRRSIEEAPADITELRFAQNMGIPMITDFAPEEILGEKGHVCGLKCKGRDGYGELILKADRVIFAIGQEQVDEFANLQAGGNIFIGGDAAHKKGATVVEAVAEGKMAAAKIRDYIDRR